MPHKMIKPRGRKSTEVDSTSGIPPMISSALSILHPSSSTVFDEFFKTRIIMKWHVFEMWEARTYHITEVCDLVDAQRLGSFLTCKDDYHGDFIRAFYAGLES